MTRSQPAQAYVEEAPSPLQTRSAQRHFTPRRSEALPRQEWQPKAPHKCGVGSSSTAAMEEDLDLEWIIGFGQAGGWEHSPCKAKLCPVKFHLSSDSSPESARPTPHHPFPLPFNAKGSRLDALWCGWNLLGPSGLCEQEFFRGPTSKGTSGCLHDSRIPQ